MNRVILCEGKTDAMNELRSQGDRVNVSFKEASISVYKGPEEVITC